MRILKLLLRGIGCIVLGFGVVVLLNLPHDWLINALLPGGARAGVPLTPAASVLSTGITTLAGIAGSFAASLTAGPHRRVTLLVLTALFLLTDVLAVLGPLRDTALWFRVLLVALVPLEVWVGYWLARPLLGRTAADAPVQRR